MQRTISTILGTRPVKGTFGIEIELEGLHFPRALTSWHVEHDPSLRGEENVEYVINKPVLIDGVEPALDELRKGFKEFGTRVDKSTRTGTHIHVNVGDLTTKQLFNYICTFLIFERSLLNLCQKHRVGNHFCLRSSDAEYAIQNLQDAAEREDFTLLSDENVRYSAMNTNSIRKYGSLEFRFIESVGDFDSIQMWCEILQSLKDFSQAVENPRNILEMFSMDGYEWFCERVLKDHAKKVLSQMGYQKDMRMGCLYAQDVAYSNTWVGSGLNIFKKNNFF